MDAALIEVKIKPLRRAALPIEKVYNHTVVNLKGSFTYH
jgi:hypothetical protein